MLVYTRSRMSASLRLFWTFTTILVLLVGHSVEQGRQFIPSYGAASPLIDHRSQYQPSQKQQQQQQQQVILPGGFQQHPIQSNLQSLRSLESRGNSRVIPSIQNGHFQLRNPSTALISPLLRPGRVSTGGSPQFSPLLTGPSGERNRHQSNGGTSSASASGSGQDQRPAESQYEYYDDTDSDIVYHYSNEDNADSSSRGGSSASSSRPATSNNGGIKKFQASRPAQTSSSSASSSSFIPLVEDEEPLGHGLAYKGRSVHPQPSQRNSASYGTNNNNNPTPLPSLLRNNSIATKYRSNPPPPPQPPSIEPATTTKRPAILRGPVNRFILTSKPPLVIQQTRVAPSAPARPHSSSSTSRFSSRNKPDTNQNSQQQQQQQEQELSPAAATATEEEYAEEYNEDDNGDYYEGEDEAQFPLSKEKLDKSSSAVETSKSSTKTTTTTTAPVITKSKATTGPGIVISVATTRSVSDGFTTPPPAPTTPKVTFSRATGSSIVVASVQTSRSVATPSSSSHQRLISSQHPPQTIVQTPPKQAAADPEYYEEEYTYPDNYPVLNGAPLSDVPDPHKPPSSPSLVSPTESIMDKLDRVQSELVNGVLNGFHLPSSTPLSTTVTTDSGAETVPTDHSSPIPPSSQSQNEKEEEKKEGSHKTKNFNFISPEISGGGRSQSGPESDGGSKAINIQSILKGIKFNDDVSAFLPPEYKSVPPITLVTTTSTSTTIRPELSSSTLNSLASGGIQFEEASISALLPKGYNKPSLSLFASKYVPSSATTAVPTTTTSTTTTESTTEKSKSKSNPLESLLAKVTFKDSLDALLPPGYKESLLTPTTSTTTEQPKIGIEALIPNIKFDDFSKFLPPGYKPPADEPAISLSTTETASSSPTTAATAVTTVKPPSNKLVFPTRPGGGLKATRPTTTTEVPRPDTPPPLKVTIQKGGPTRATTEFTGWPTQSTTPTPSTTTTPTTTTTTTTTTTKRTTTTTLPPKRSPVSSCWDLMLCKMEAVLRIVGLRWKPEYSDINTEEWKHLEKTVKRELDAAYRSSGLAQYYRTVEIEGFTRGSVIVDYFVLLENVTAKLTSADVRALFHASLQFSDQHEQHEDNRELDSVPLAADERLRLGRYTIDPKYTDFKVRNTTTEVPGASTSESFIPQWGIAVIVIGLASLMFVIIFGVTVLVNRHKKSKKAIPLTMHLTQEMLSEFNKSHVGVDNYGTPDDLYNMDDVWDDNSKQTQQHHMDRTFDRKIGKRASSSGKGSANYNIYDSWKTEWNGYHYNGNYYGDSGYAPSRRRSDYDTNF